MCDKTKCGFPSGRTPHFLLPCILLLIHEKPSYGYEIIEDMKRKRYTEIKPDVGAVYRILRKLEKKSCVKSAWINQNKGPVKRTYTITAKGKRLIDDWAKSLFVKRASINRFLADFGKMKKGGE